MASSEASPTSSLSSRSKEQFFRYFQLEATALQEQMARLEKLSAIGGERVDGIEHCLAGIARLQKEVQDAAAYVPSYDQKIYSEAIKALHEKLGNIRTSLQPKPKFAFKRGLAKNETVVSPKEDAEYAPPGKPHMPEDSRGSQDIATSDTSSSPAEAATRPSGPYRRGSLGRFLDAAGQKSPSNSNDAPDNTRVRRMSFAQANSVLISNYSDVHIILPSSASHATSSGSLTDLHGCVVDMSMPTENGKPFATLAIKNVKQSLLICGNVNGAAHVTGVANSVLVVAARQLRMHDCRNIVLYLHSNSQPIIEDCEHIRFAPIATRFKPTAEDLSNSENQWDQIQDFKWLKSEPSPHWKVLPEEQRVSDDQWSKIASTAVELPLEESLRISGVPQA